MRSGLIRPPNDEVKANWRNLWGNHWGNHTQSADLHSGSYDRYFGTFVLNVCDSVSFPL